MIIPDDVMNIISSYKKQFERVDNAIFAAMISYFCVSHRSEKLTFSLRDVCHGSAIKRLEHIVRESRRILSQVLKDEEITEIQQTLLQILHDETYNIMFLIV